MAAKKKKAWATRRLPPNQGLKVGDNVHIVVPHDYTIMDRDGPVNKVSENEMPFPFSIETTMIALERSIDNLIQRIDEQTKRIKGMM